MAGSKRKSSPATPAAPRAPRAKRGEPGALTCVYSKCPRENHLITLPEQINVVRVQAGPMHRDCWQNMRARFDESMQAAIAAGTHSTARATRICTGCNVDTIIYTGEAQGKAEYCFACAMVRGFFDNLTERQLMQYAGGELPNPCDAEFPARCQAALARRRERRAALQRFASGTGF